MINLGIVGATGMVGRTILEIMEERNFPIKNLYLFASHKSEGTVIEYNNRPYKVEVLNENSFNKDLDMLLFSSGGKISKEYAPIAREKGIIVVDNSSCWRMEDWVPLIVPEVNPEAINKHRGIISNPNCSTIQAVVPLKLLKDKYGLERIVFSTYQSVSGSGVGGLMDLEKGINSNYHNKYPYPIAYNVLPHIDDFLENGYTKEEMKMIEEVKKILDDENVRITATTARVPVKYGHSISANIELKNKFNLEDIYELFRKSNAIEVLDDTNNNIYPMPIIAEGSDKIYLGRIRRDFSLENGLNIWIVADNIRKGAATNTIQIAELLLNK
jgi:aspartate-semialdehyde dehydrogenase